MLRRIEIILDVRLSQVCSPTISAACSFVRRPAENCCLIAEANCMVFDPMMASLTSARTHSDVATILSPPAKSSTPRTAAKSARAHHIASATEWERPHRARHYRSPKRQKILSTRIQKKYAIYLSRDRSFHNGGYVTSVTFIPQSSTATRCRNLPRWPTRISSSLETRRIGSSTPKILFISFSACAGSKPSNGTTLINAFPDWRDFVI